MPDDARACDPFWTAPQRRALIVLLSILLVFLTGRYACNRAFIDDPQPDVPARRMILPTSLTPILPTGASWPRFPILAKRRRRRSSLFARNGMPNIHTTRPSAARRSAANKGNRRSNGCKPHALSDFPAADDAAFRRLLVYNVA